MKRASPGQKRYLISLGYSGAKPVADLSAAEASQFIQELKQNPPNHPRARGALRRRWVRR